MATHLDCVRLQELSFADPLSQYLMTVCDQDQMRRVKVYYPEYFTENALEHGEVRFSMLMKRFMYLKSDGEDMDTVHEKTLSWFGLEELRFCSHKQAGGGEVALPPDFKRLHDDGYNPAKEPWEVEVTDREGRATKILVLEIIMIGDDPDDFFLIGTNRQKIFMDAVR